MNFWRKIEIRRDWVGFGIKIMCVLLVLLLAGIGLASCLDMNNYSIELYKVIEANGRIWREPDPSLTRDIKAGDTIYFEDIAIVVK